MSSLDNLYFKLHNYIKSNDYQNVVKLIEQGLNVNRNYYIDSCYDALYSAYKYKRIDIFNFFITKNCDINKRYDKQDNTLLHYSCRSGDLDMVQIIVEHGANIHLTNCQLDTPLKCAYYDDNEHSNIVKYLISKGADIESCDLMDRTIMYIACDKQDVDMVDFLIKCGANVNMYNAIGYTPLHIACERNNNKIVEILLTCCQILKTTTDLRGYTPLHIACQNNNIEIVKLLIDNDAACGNNHIFDVRMFRKDCPSKLLEEIKRIYIPKELSLQIFDAVYYNYDDKVKQLIKDGADVNTIAPYTDISILHQACESGNINIVKMLINHPDININILQTYQKKYPTPIFKAVSSCHINIVKLLLEHGADIDIKNDDGETVLHLAVKQNSIKLTTLLISNRVHVTAKCNDGYSALDHAAWNNNSDIISILLRVGALKSDKCHIDSSLLSPDFPSYIKEMIIKLEERYIRKQEGGINAM